jgi:DNA-binding NtrC family response regulator
MAGHAGARRILLVDDDEVFREASATLLRSSGYEVILASDHRLVLQILESDKPIDLLIADIVMPERVNGLALGRMARLRRPEIKLLYISGYDIPGLQDEALGPIIKKPVDNDRFLAEVGRALES